MTTTTRMTLETDKVVGELVPDPAVEQQGKAMDAVAPAAVPWSQLAPSDYEVLARMFAFRIPDEERQAPAIAAAVVAEPVDEKDLTRAAFLAAVLALVETGVAHLAIEEKAYFFGLFVSRTVWVSKGDSQESWPGGSIESSLQGRLTGTPVEVRELVAGWIGDERLEHPWRDMRDRIVYRLVRQGTVERHREKQSFLFFSWTNTTDRAAGRTEGDLAGYASAARRAGLGLPLRDRSPSRLAQGEVISGEIDNGFAARTVYRDNSD